LGFKHTVKGLDGHDIVLSRSGVTQPGHVDTIPGEGMPIYHLSGHGDLFVEYQVVFPPTLSTKLKTGQSKALALSLSLSFFLRVIRAQITDGFFFVFVM
jgi:DnaJ-related protein SCJ1